MDRSSKSLRFHERAFKPADFLEWAKKQVAVAKELVSCYEAGPTCKGASQACTGSLSSLDNALFGF